MSRLLRLLPLALLLLGLMGAKGGCDVGMRNGAGVTSYSAPGHHREHAYARRVFGNDRAGQRCLLALWQRESGWNPDAVNRKSGAYGIPQAHGHGRPFALGDWRAQIRWGHRYIVRRYGDACTAWDQEMAHGWY